MSGTRGHILKFGAFGVVMVVLTAFLFMIFGQYRTGSTNAYSAVFVDVSGLKTGDSVRAGGLRVGTVADISMRPDHTVTVAFDADRTVVLSSGTAPRCAISTWWATDSWNSSTDQAQPE